MTSRGVKWSPAFPPPNRGRHRLDRPPRAVIMRVLEDRCEVYSAIKAERVDWAILSDNTRAPNP
jgi:hypothetical protein